MSAFEKERIRDLEMLFSDQSIELAKVKAERDEARACLLNAMEYLESDTGTRGPLSGCSVADFRMEKWRKAAGIDTSNNQAEGRASRTLPRMVGGTIGDKP